ncbi:MAG: hypothetical protein ACHQVK_05160, partial [Candidatus Paceibacterales bacterium]
ADRDILSYYLARIYLDCKRPEMAKKYFKMVTTDADELYLNARFELGLYYSEEKQHENAEECFIQYLHGNKIDDVTKFLDEKNDEPNEELSIVKNKLNLIKELRERDQRLANSENAEKTRQQNPNSFFLEPKIEEAKKVEKDVEEKKLESSGSEYNEQGYAKISSMKF